MKQLLENAPSVDPSTISFTNTEGSTTVAWSFRSTTSHWNGRTLYSNADNNKPISALLLETPDLCLGEIVKSYGEPDRVFSLAYTAGLAYIIWQKDGLVYSTSLSASDTGISQNTCGGSILFFVIGTPLTQIPGTPGLVSSDITDADFVAWKGYGKY